MRPSIMHSCGAKVRKQHWGCSMASFSPSCRSVFVIFLLAIVLSDGRRIFWSAISSHRRCYPLSRFSFPPLSFFNYDVPSMVFLISSHWDRNQVNLNHLLRPYPFWCGFSQESRPLELYCFYFLEKRGNPFPLKSPPVAQPPPSPSHPPLTKGLP